MTDLDVRLEALLEAAAAPTLPLPDPIATAYGGPLALPDEVVYANFVASIDGVAAIEGIRMSSATISGGAPADRFVMALLRAAADAIVVGSGTLEEHGGPWTAEKAFPPAAGHVGELRSAIGAVGSTPTLVVATASGDLPPDHPAVASAVVVTTSSGARAIAESGIACAEVVDLGDAEEVDPRGLIDALRDRGHRRILTEGGPSLMGSMLGAGVVEQLFLTVSPTLIGGGEGRAPLSGETDLLEADRGARLLSVRRTDHLLFLRYDLTSA